MELGFANCLIGDISALEGMGELYQLILYNCGITDISALSGCTSLNEPDIGENNIKDLSPLDSLEIEKLYTTD